VAFSLRKRHLARFGKGTETLKPLRKIGGGGRRKLTEPEAGESQQTPVSGTCTWLRDEQARSATLPDRHSDAALPGALPLKREAILRHHHKPRNQSSPT
jgi:hypothetical protein